MKQARVGFTLVELLIVIVVIAILAAISIVAYNGIQDRANDTAVKSDLSNAAKKIANYRVIEDAYPTTHATMPQLSFTAAAIDTSRANNVWYCLNSATGVYALGVVSKSGKGFVVRSDSSVYEYTTETGGLNTNRTCREVGLTDWSDANAIGIVGFKQSAPQWTAWTGVKN